MMMLAFIGIVPFLRNGKNKVAILTFFLLNYYLVCAWNIWWYGGRAMVQSYPVLIFTIAALTDAVLKEKIYLWILTPLAILFAYVNFWVIYQSHLGNLFDDETMNARYYWRVVGRWHAPERTRELLDNPDLFEGTPQRPEVIYQNNFKDDSGECYITTADGKKYLSLNKERQASPSYRFAFNGENATWLRVQATFDSKEKEWASWKMAQFIVQLMDKNNANKVVKTNAVRVYQFLNGYDHKDISLDIKLPNVHYDSVNIVFWNSYSDKELAISNLQALKFN